MAEWRFGMILEHKNGEVVLFLRHDKERGQMMGGGIGWFVGMRLKPADRAVNSKVGAMNNYSVYGWVEKDDVTEVATTTMAIAARTGIYGSRAQMEAMQETIDKLALEIADRVKRQGPIGSAKP